MRQLLGVLIFTLWGCSGSPSSQAQTESMKAHRQLQIPIEQLALPYCPECEMSFQKFPIADTMTYNAKLYGFCSEPCKEAFKERMGV